jgi:apolipoprotein N-acyltransferase
MPKSKGIMALCGLLLGLSAPGYALWWLAWLILIPAFRWVRQQAALRDIFLGGFWLGFWFQGLYCLWFFDLHPLSWLGFSEWGSRLTTLGGWLIITVEGGLLMGMLMVAYRQLRSDWLRVAVFPLLWVLGFSILNWTPMALPWGLLSYTQAALWPVRALAAGVGASGIAALVVLHNVLWECFFPKGLYRWAIVVVPLLLGFLQILPPPLKPQPWPMPVAIIQGNLPIEVIRSGALGWEDIGPAYYQPLQAARLPAGTLVVYPEEGVVPGWVPVQTPLDNFMLAELHRLAREKRVFIAVGVSAMDARNHRYNSLALLSPAGTPVQFYHKRRLVPFGEYTPYGLGGSLSSLLSAFNVDYSASYDPGREATLLRAGHVRLGGLICFELIDANPMVGGYAREYAEHGAHLLVNVSNLGWFHQNPLMEAQFLAIGQMRAAETGLPLVISSNTGISAAVSARGEVLRSTRPIQFSPHKSQILFYNGEGSQNSSR